MPMVATNERIEVSHIESGRTTNGITGGAQSKNSSNMQPTKKRLQLRSKMAKG